MYLGAMSRLDDAGYVQYEISNVSKPGLESRHNLKYWSDGEWLGFGCGAHSTRRGIREKNVSSTEDYVSAVAAGRSVETDRRVLSDQERFEEAVFTGLRLSRGVDLEGVRSRYGVDLWDRYGEDLSPFVEQRLLIYDGGAIRLTRDGMLLANEVMTVFIGPPVR
jgi:oxygen-independent coproporphyrinogen-3 oxidase